MKKVIICKGLPASGKSTFAKALVKENKGIYKRINKDDLRQMLDTKTHSKSNENFVLSTRDWLITSSLKNGKSVIIDDTNLHEKHEVRIREVVKKYCDDTSEQVKIEIKFFDTSLEECLKRDLKRVDSVGERIIKQMYKQYLDTSISTVLRIQDESLPKAIICDLDGTLAIITNRSPFDGSKCEQDMLNKPIADMVKNYYKIGHKIILLSGRLDLYKEQTIRWLSKYEIPYDQIIMRDTKDNRKDAIVKREFYDNKIEGKFFVEFVLDDRNQVVDMWRQELGLTCLQVNYGDF